MTNKTSGAATLPAPAITKIPRIKRAVKRIPAPNVTSTIPMPLAASQMASTHFNADAAKKLVEFALKKESRITQDVVSIAKKSGSCLEGLEDRVKTVESTARKLENVAGVVSSSTSGRDVGNYINDGLRYTFTVPEQNYTSVVATMIQELEQKGFSISYTKNFWRVGNTYKGLNLDTNRDSLRIEIQFHTPESYQLKKQTLDSLYQKYRIETDSDTRAQLKQTMVNASAGITIPSNIAHLGNPMRNIR